MELIQNMFRLKLDICLFFRGGRKICDAIFEGVWPFVTPCDEGGRGRQKSAKEAWRHLWMSPYTWDLVPQDIAQIQF